MEEPENLNARVPPSPFCFSSDRARRRNPPNFGAITAAAVFSLLTLTLSCHAAASADGKQAAALLRFAPQENGASLVPFLAPKETNTGCAVLIVPESGSGSNREMQLAKWLNNQGIAGFLLQPGPQAPNGSLTDTEISQAMRYLRAQGRDLGISSRRVGLFGFGHGAERAVAWAEHRDPAAEPAGSNETATARISDRPDFLVLIGGSALSTDGKAPLPPTFLAASARSGDGLSGAIERWGRLRAARVAVDAHFFARADAASGPAPEQPSLNSWPESLQAWLHSSGFLTDTTRVAIKGMVLLDGQPLPHGYVIFTPLNGAGPGTGPVIGRVLNSTVGVPIGEFSLPLAQGPVPGRYRVDVRQDMSWWLSNSFSGDLVNARGAPTPAQVYFGHHRRLEPSIDDQHSYPKVHPSDPEATTIEFLPGADANLQLKIEVFSGNPPTPVPEGNARFIGGLLDGPKNPGQAAYLAQLQSVPPWPVPRIPEPILLWPSGAPGAVPDADGVFTDEDKPALYPFPVPARPRPTAAFLILPGGAFTNRTMDNEGVQVARFLNRQGIAGFVLRYRIGPNYPDRATSTRDAHRAMQFLRAHAAEYGFPADRLGVIGFSAGAELAGDAFYNHPLNGDPTASDPLERVSARANFGALIYGGRLLQHPTDAPPTFLFNTVEDAGHLAVEAPILSALNQAGVSVEAHFYQVGPHGTGLAPGDPQLGQWPELMIRWLEGAGF